MSPSLPDALRLTADDGVLKAGLTGDFSNGPQGQPPEKGFPFGGLLAALAAGAMREGLGLAPPLRTLNVQFLAAARFGREVEFRPRLLRGGRNVAYAAVEAGQGERLALHATATYGADAETVVLKPLIAPPPPLESLDPAKQIRGPMAPWFTQVVDYRFEDGPNILGGHEGKDVIVERLWMRTRDGAPLDEARLCYLLDALYPPAWTAFRRPPMMTSVDLRYDILTDPTPETAPDGWAFFEYRMHEIGAGWTVDDVTCWGADGTPLALGRQRRKLL